METLTKILEYNPILTLIFGFILALVAMWLFRSEIKAYIKKKYNLFDEEQVANLMAKAAEAAADAPNKAVNIHTIIAENS